MPDTPKPHSWLGTLGGTIVGLVCGCITMYTWLEHRIESRVEAKVMTEVRLNAIEMSQKSNKDASWLADGELNKRVDALHERIMQLSNKVDGLHLQAAPATPTSTPP